MWVAVIRTAKSSCASIPPYYQSIGIEIMGRKYNILDKNGVAVAADKSKKYIRRRDGSITIATTEQAQVAAVDELTFSGSKSDIRKGEMGERNVTVLHNLILDVEATVKSTSDKADGNLSLAYAKTDKESIERQNAVQDLTSSIEALEANSVSISSDVSNAFPKTGGVMTGHIVPATDIDYDLGAPDKRWRDVYIGPGSLYIGGQKVLESDADTIVITADRNQNVSMRAKGYGDLEFTTDRGSIQIRSDVLMAKSTGFNTSDSSPIPFHSGINVEGEKITNLAMPTSKTDAASKSYVDSAINTVSSAAEIEQAIALSEAGTLAQVALVNSLVSANDIDIANLKTETAVNDSAIDKLNVDVAGLLSGAGSTLSLVNTAKGDISRIESNINTIEANITSASVKIGNTEQLVATQGIQANLLLASSNKAATDITALQSYSSDLASKAAKAASDITILFNGIDSLASKAAKNTTANAANASEVARVESKVDVVESDLAAKAAILASHSAVIDGLVGDTADADSVTALKYALENEIAAEVARAKTEEANLSERLASYTSMTSGSSAPSAPTPGDTWYNTSNQTLYISVFDGDSTQWIDIS